MESVGERSTNATAGAGESLRLKRVPGLLFIFKVEYWLPTTVVLCGLGLWEIAANWGWVSKLFFPPPSFILQTLLIFCGSGEFWVSLGMTVFRLASSIAIGASVGIIFGWLMGASRPCRIALDPLVAALHPMPKLAIFPIFLIILGIGEPSKIALISLAAFFPMLINTLAGVQHIDRTYLEVATNYGAKGSALLRRVIIPGSLPMAMTGLRLAFNNALVVTIAIEMLSAQEGLGAMIWMTWQTLRTEELYATLVVIGLLGLLSNAALRKLVRMLTPWHRNFSEN